MTPEHEGSADRPDVAALTEAEREALCVCPPWMVTGRRKRKDEGYHSHACAQQRLAVERILADRLAAVTAQRDQYAAQVAALTSALERTETGFIAAVNNRPVRDMAETLAENRAALRADGGGSQ